MSGNVWTEGYPFCKDECITYRVNGYCKGCKNYEDHMEVIKINEVQVQVSKDLDATDVQVGGDHYKHYAIQPIEFIVKNNIPYIEGCVIKYLLRHGDKGGAQDLEKAKHYIDLLLELEY